MFSFFTNERKKLKWQLGIFGSQTIFDAAFSYDDATGKDTPPSFSENQRPVLQVAYRWITGGRMTGLQEATQRQRDAANPLRVRAWIIGSAESR